MSNIEYSVITSDIIKSFDCINANDGEITSYLYPVFNDWVPIVFGCLCWPACMYVSVCLCKKRKH